MKNSVIYALWAVVYGICAGLGFVKEPEGFGKGLLIASGLICFLPPFYLAWKAKKEKNASTIKVLRLISGGVLALTLLMLVLNFLSVYFSPAVGRVLYGMLILFSAPMVCMQYWVLGLFLWACVLMVSLKQKTK